ncbi:sugar-phospahte nucleotidyltransferase [Clostridium perfringens]|uniref:sugar-phospahte nucleotidyltransferase n=1 Tax=Clostridium perfringens TaxID=1502 RepID=UPI00096A7820|nr:sugar-phospahte nucleotidyltransferase [Clostridium perfringens]
MAQIQYKFNKNDEYFTPSYAVYPIIKHLKPNSVIWCPFDKEDSEYVKVFKREGFRVIYGHIETGQDFFEVEIPKCDYIISNPPYSLKGDIFKRLYETKIPFAMLINFQGIFDHRERFEMFKNKKVEMLWLSPRVNYIKPNETKASGVPFQSGYLCSNIFQDSLNFEYLDKSL